MPLTPPENIRKPEVSKVFRGYQKRSVTGNGLSEFKRIQLISIPPEIIRKPKVFQIIQDKNKLICLNSLNIRREFLRRSLKYRIIPKEIQSFRKSKTCINTSKSTPLVLLLYVICA